MATVYRKTFTKPLPAGSDIPIRADLAEDLRQWLSDKLRLLRAEALRRGQRVPEKLPPETPLFYVPDGLLRILNRDLQLAGIAKVDERGRTVDIHALQYTFGTHLSKGGVAPRTAQAATGIPLVYDVHHHRCNPDGLSVEQATKKALATWNREPMFHLSSPIEGWHGPKPERHHDFIDVNDFPDGWRRKKITVEIEAKAKELAVKKLLTELNGRKYPNRLD